MESPIGQIFGELYEASRRAPYPSLEQRLHLLGALQKEIAASKFEIAEAIDQDFGGRPVEETLQLEIFPALSALSYCRRHLARWMRPEPRRVGRSFWFASNRVVYQPLGVVGVIAPWNYPFYLAMAPVIGALAAGNRVIVRPSSQTPNTALVLKRLVEEAPPADFVRALCGERSLAAEMLALPFDHIVFTGSTSVGRDVMRAASANLTPVTLELGGKSPAIVHESYPHEEAARRIALGKFLNAGQTCVAPDYVLVQEDRRGELIDRLTAALEKMYPAAQDNPQFTSILGEKHFLRLAGLLEDARANGAQIIQPQAARVARQSKERGFRFPPTLVAGVTDAMRLSQEEIFGPILPVRTYRAFEDIFDYLSKRPRPLALYYFDKDRGRIGRILRETASGGVVVNGTLFHIAQDDLPFGGVGESGLGRYHAVEGFRTFSNQRAVHEPYRFNLARLLEPPWTARLRAMLDRATRS
ncbi:MAG: coniferyl aldehyde dehydrogenase [Rhodomicrobium sp.]